MGKSSPLLEEALMSTRENPIERYWQIIMVMATLLIGGAGAMFKIDALADQVADNKVRIEQGKDEKNEVEKKLVKIETNQEHFREQVKEIKEEISENADKLDKIIDKLNEG